MRYKIFEISQEYGFDNYKLVGYWQEYAIYSPFNYDEEIPCIGEPIFILSNKKETRIATKEEYNQFIEQLDED